MSLSAFMVAMDYEANLARATESRLNVQEQRLLADARKEWREQRGAHLLVAAFEKRPDCTWMSVHTRTLDPKRFPLLHALARFYDSWEAAFRRIDDELGDVTVDDGWICFRPLRQAVDPLHLSALSERAEAQLSVFSTTAAPPHLIKETHALLECQTTPERIEWIARTAFCEHHTRLLARIRERATRERADRAATVTLTPADWRGSPQQWRKSLNQIALVHQSLSNLVARGFVVYTSRLFSEISCASAPKLWSPGAADEIDDCTTLTITFPTP